MRRALREPGSAASAPRLDGAPPRWDSCPPNRVLLQIISAPATTRRSRMHNPDKLPHHASFGGSPAAPQQPAAVSRLASCLLAAGALATILHPSPTPPPPSRPPTPPPTPPSSGGTSARRATASLRRRASSATATPTTWAPRRAASTRPPTAACTGTRSSTTSRCSRSGRWGVAMADPNIVWAGTGEGKIRSHVSVGQGVYKSTDAGATWTLMGLERTGRTPAARHPPRQPGHRVHLRHGARLRAAARARRLPHRPTGAPPGSTSCSSTRTRAARTSRWTRRTRGCSSRAPGSSRSTPGGAPPADPAAACTFRATGATPGRS